MNDKSIKIKDLVEFLSKLPQDAVVCAEVNDRYYDLIKIPCRWNDCAGLVFCNTIPGNIINN